MKKYLVTFYLINGHTLQTVIASTNVKTLSESLTSKGPYLTFHDEVDPEHKTFSINMMNVVNITYLPEEEK